FPSTTLFRSAREVAMRERDPRVRARRDGRRNARHDLEGNAGRSERERFLPAASEHQWVAALEAHHALARPAERDELLIDDVLRCALLPVALAHVADSRARPLI